MSMAKPKAKTLEEVRSKYEGVFDALNHNSDLVCAVVTTSYINDAAGALLLGFFCGKQTPHTLLMHDGGVLGELRAKSEVLYCCGLISKPFLTNLITVAEIRNKFAHTFEEITFSAPEVAELCNKLLPPKNRTIVSDDPERTEQMMHGTPRRRFITTAITMISFLVMEAMQVERRPKKSDVWGD